MSVAARKGQTPEWLHLQCDARLHGNSGCGVALTWVSVAISVEAVALLIQLCSGLHYVHVGAAIVYIEQEKVPAHATAKGDKTSDVQLCIQKSREVGRSCSEVKVCAVGSHLGPPNLWRA